ncbi:MAG: hypothetical protein DRJ10_00360 [Bacteroidetes bacterium]|nr:MAG: hypothetical protein DRJ10_00360 [Bacteroidota bacterium]
MNKPILIFCLILFFFGQILAQNPFPEKTRVFDDETLPRIDIFIDTDSLALIFQDVESDHEYPANFTFTRNTDLDILDTIGFRLRGNTSRYSQKKSFKIAVNSFEKGRNFLGLEKLNINGEHNDPSIIRSKLSWDIFRKFKVIGSRTAHVKMYINNDYYGLYMNIEHIDDQFVELRYGSQSGNLYKCTWPADLNYISDNPDDYKPENGSAYELKTNKEANDYSDLATFIDILNNTSDAEFPAEIEKIFNVNNYLKYLAVAYFIGHWDGYSYNKNNYYLYNNPLSSKFEFIPYDLDNTFGIDWFGIDWSTHDIYSWAHPSEERPLTNRILAKQTYLDRFSFYMNQLLDSIVHPDTLFPIIDAKKLQIEQAAYDDTYRTLDYNWDNNDFDDSYIHGLSAAHVPIGLKQYITARYNSAKSQLVLNNIAPIVSYVSNNNPLTNEDIVINCTVEDETAGPDVTLFYKINDGSEQSIGMLTNGSGKVNYIGGLNYQISFSGIAESGKIEYHIRASDNLSAVTREPISGYYEINISNAENSLLYINEFMASNDVSVPDNNGDYPDWIEIYNAGDKSVYLGDKYLSDDFLDNQKWQMPDINIGSGEYFVFWASGNPANGQMHTNFKLKLGGEQIAIFNAENMAFSIIDSVTFSEQSTDISMGRYPDGTGDFVIMGEPTPGASNINTGITKNDYFGINFHYYPNPLNTLLYIIPENGFTGEIVIELMNISGSIVHSQTKNISSGSEIVLNLAYLNNGTYFLRLIDGKMNKVIGSGMLLKQ